MALRANSIAGSAELLTVGVMAVRAGNAGRMHSALQECCVRVNLITLLPVWKKKSGLKERRAECIQKLSCLRRFGRELMPSRMTGRAYLDLIACLANRR